MSEIRTNFGVDSETMDWADAYERPASAQLHAEVWWCGDDWCDCSEAQIVERTPNTRNPKFWDRRTLWSGTFRTDGELGATSDLNRAAKYLRRHHNALYHQISWPWDRSAHPDT